MKILWIPGRKKHDRKGIYSSTKNVIDFVLSFRQFVRLNLLLIFQEVNKNYLPQKKNQVWALGGNEQRKLINM